MQVVPICIPELELVRVAQIVTISSELCQAYKFALADGALRSQFNLETRVSMAAAASFSATDYLQARCSLSLTYRGGVLRMNSHQGVNSSRPGKCYKLSWGSSSIPLR